MLVAAKGERFCDQKRPGCSQCARKRALCPGYRDMSSQIFRDLTQVTVRKYHAKRSQSAIASSSQNKSPKLVKAKPSLSLENVALNFFIRVYAPSSPSAWLTYLESVLSCTDANSQLSLSAVLAPAIAIFSHEQKRPSLMYIARRYYLTAIADTGLRLTSIQHAVRDSTLMSINLLTLFEARAFQGRSPPTDWTTHIEGAVELIRLRGNDQFKSVLGQALFLDTVNNIRTSCAQRRIALPAPIQDLLQTLLQKDSPPLSYGILEIGVGNVVDNIIGLVAGMQTGAVYCNDYKAVILEGLRLDSQVSELSRQLWSIQSYRVLPTDASGAWRWSGLAHDYDNPQSARLWNLLRMLRLYLNKWICRAYKKAVFEQQQQQKEEKLLEMGQEFQHIPETAASNTVLMAEYILSSVPYFCSLILSLEASSSSALSSTVRWLIWPLSVVAVSPLSPVSMQIHARDCLRKLGEEMGSAQAVEIANMLDNSETLEDWYASHPRMIVDQKAWF
ncbi:uncharacterized protein BHQ10_000326 [Talaromyces amestolkiae]|uniref:Zn(2)-C6 fungal-type domain-containing protein n=1 Tax=Talaromyces amestolkiae TaxID=1196081 RepID=A0A364KL97_TALAM|nr:uncharacterized protein BHQ10_000326 [Talaromyces amestolkiae]RAO64314.1 hypothetical protein BHQ10_000326 [Talaromyces amestolkiae]